MTDTRAKELLAQALKHKERRRNRLAGASLGEKILIVEAMRKGLRPLKEAKPLRRSAK
jgi:hypothetical protein